MAISVDEDVLSGQPRIDGTRVGVLHIYETVVAGNSSPADAAASLDISIGDVHEALAYYYNHPEEMARHRREQEAALEALRDRVIRPPAELERVE